MTIIVNLKGVSIQYGENQRTTVEADVTKEIAPGIEQVVGAYTLSFDGTFQDGEDTAGMKSAVEEMLREADLL